MSKKELWKYGLTRRRFLPTHVEPFFHFQNSVGGHIQTTYEVFLEKLHHAL